MVALDWCSPAVQGLGWKWDVVLAVPMAARTGTCPAEGFGCKAKTKDYSGLIS